MSLWRHVTGGLRVLLHRAAADDDLSDEVEHYLQQATAAYVARGLSPEVARRVATLEMGNVTAVREQVRGAGWEHSVDTLTGDLRYAIRQLRHAPGFTVVTVLTLALGIGATTAIFSAVNPILLEPLPYPDPSRIVTLRDRQPDGSPQEGTFGLYRELVARSRTLQSIAVMKPWQPTMTTSAEPERFEGQRVSASYFHVLGVAPAMGRSFESSDDRLNGSRVTIISDALWRRRFGADSTVLGRTVTLDGDSYAIIGILPPTFESVLAPSATIWAPLQYDMSLGAAWGHHLGTIGRVRKGLGAADAARELARIALTPVAEFPRMPWASAKDGFVVASLQDDVTRAVKPALLAVLGAVALVLVIACVNVTNLLLARGSRRDGEFAVRAALGAGRGRVIRQLLTESLVLAALGGVLGLVVAAGGVRALVAVSPVGLPRLDAITLDGSAFAFTFGVTMLVGVAFGVVPALHASRRNLHVALQSQSRRSAGGHHRMRRALVVAEVALALVLLVGSGLLLRSLQRLFAVAPGFDASQLVTLQVQTSGHRFAADAPTWRFFEQTLDAVRRVPGVVSVGFTSQLPLSGDFDQYGVHFEAAPGVDPLSDGGAFRYAVSPGYLETMRIPLRHGRLLDARDVAGAPPVVLLNESFARRTFPGVDPIGQRMRVGPNDGEWYTIVGIVGDVKQVSLELSQSEAVYMTPEQWHWADHALSLVFRGRGDAESLLPAIRAAIWSVDKDQPIVRVATMEGLLAASAAERHFALVLFEAFALVALALAAAGIYGVLSGSVTDRLRELGVRAALGATRGSLHGLVLRQGMSLTATGAVIGLLGAAAASRVLATLLFGVSPLDPITYARVIAVLVIVAAVACWLPAWRAARVDPSITLRAE